MFVDKVLLFNKKRDKSISLSTNNALFNKKRNKKQKTVDKICLRCRQNMQKFRQSISLSTKYAFVQQKQIFVDKIQFCRQIYALSGLLPDLVDKICFLLNKKQNKTMLVDKNMLFWPAGPASLSAGPAGRPGSPGPAGLAGQLPDFPDGGDPHDIPSLMGFSFSATIQGGPTWVCPG